MNDYAVLGLNPGASIEEVKKAYRKKVKEYHPDAGGDPEKFKQVQAAYENITDPKPKEQFNPFGGRGDNPFVEFDINDLFGQFFNHEQLDIILDVTIGFGEAYTNQRKTIQYNRKVIINGKLEYRIEELNIDNISLMENRAVAFPGKGHFSTRRPGMAGKLIVQIKYKLPQNWTKRGNDLEYFATIDPLDLAVGVDISVPLPTGDITVNVPEKTQPGSLLRVKGKGFNIDETTRGDLYIRIEGKFDWSRFTDEIKTAILNR